MSLLNSVSGVGACVAWVAWVHKILARVEVSAWVAQIEIWSGSKKRRGCKCLTILSYSIESTVPSVVYNLIVPNEFNKLYSSPML